MNLDGFAQADIPPRRLGIWERETILAGEGRLEIIFVVAVHSEWTCKAEKIASGVYVFYVELQGSYHAITEPEMFHALDNSVVECMEHLRFGDSRGWTRGNLQGLWEWSRSCLHLIQSQRNVKAIATNILKHMLQEVSTDGLPTSTDEPMEPCKVFELNIADNEDGEDLCNPELLNIEDLGSIWTKRSICQ